jgi:hypothetical protein
MVISIYHQYRLKDQRSFYGPETRNAPVLHVKDPKNTGARSTWAVSAARTN